MGDVLRRLRGCAAAVEGDEGGLGKRRLANRAGLLGGEPLVDAWPAVEVATEGDNRVLAEIQADVAVEAATSGVTTCRRSLGMLIQLHCCSPCCEDGSPFNLEYENKG